MLIVVAVAAWLAHSMWRVVRARARQDPEPVRSRELHPLLRSWPILASGLPEVTALVLAGAGAWSVATGLRIAQGLGVGVLFAAGLLTARLAGATRSRELIYVIALPGVGPRDRLSGSGGSPRLATWSDAGSTVTALRKIELRGGMSSGGDQWRRRKTERERSRRHGEEEAWGRESAKS